MDILLPVIATVVALFTVWLGIETYVFTRPQQRQYFVGFLFYTLVCWPIAIPIECTTGPIGDRIRAAYRAAQREITEFEQTGKQKLIG